jgi:GTPase SAR1 family protein
MQYCGSFAGFNVETVEYKNISFTVWDVGGQDKVFQLSFPYNYLHASVLICGGHFLLVDVSNYVSHASLVLADIMSKSLCHVWKCV